MVLKPEEFDDLYLSFLNDRELTKKDIGNLFDTFGELLNTYKELLEGCKKLSACNL